MKHEVHEYKPGLNKCFICNVTWSDWFRDYRAHNKYDEYNLSPAQQMAQYDCPLWDTLPVERKVKYKLTGKT